MRSKLHKVRLQACIVDEDNDGDSINEVWLDMQEWVGNKNFQKAFPEYLEQLSKFLADRNEQLAKLESGEMYLEALVKDTAPVEE